jgi:hypothetical protein
MNERLRRRLERLEGPYRREPGELPLVLPDDAPADELERLCAAGIEAVRFAEFVEACV